MSEDVPIYLDRGQKSSSDSHDEKAERKHNFSQKRKTRLSDVVSSVTARANGQEYSKILNFLHSKVEQSTP